MQINDCFFILLKSKKAEQDNRRKHKYVKEKHAMWYDKHGLKIKISVWNMKQNTAMKLGHD